MFNMGSRFADRQIDMDSSRHQVILITIDTLRADHLGSSGYHRNTAPALNRLALSGITFSWAFSPTSYTVPSHYSLMTSRYPSFHSVGFHNGRVPVRDCDETTLAETLQTRGFATGAFISSSVLSLRNAPQIGKGFTEFDEAMTHHESTRQVELRRWAMFTNKAALAWIETNRCRDFFCWIHYMDVHGPYEAPQPYCDWFLNEIMGLPEHHLKVVPNGALGGIPKYQLLTRALATKPVEPQRNFHYYVARYDGGIRYVDAALDDLLAGLRKIGIVDDILLIITSDQGEALGENSAYFFHGLTVTLDQVHVPLIFAFPKLCGFRPRLVTTQVSLIDLAPTILDWLGLHGPPTYQGRSLLDVARGLNPAHMHNRVIFAETQTQVCAIGPMVQFLLGKGIPEELEFPFYHPDAPTAQAVVSYRDSVSYPRESAMQNLRVEVEAYMERASRARRTILSRKAGPAEQPDEALIYSHLEALGYV